MVGHVSANPLNPPAIRRARREGGGVFGASCMRPWKRSASEAPRSQIHTLSRPVPKPDLHLSGGFQTHDTNNESAVTLTA
jgi:hypothetical protein